MRQDCIVDHPDEARQGVSRATIKKVDGVMLLLCSMADDDLFRQYAETKYRMDTSGTNLYQLNRAIASGAEKGTFVLPKGPSGKVKLAPKVRASASKEVRRIMYRT